MYVVNTNIYPTQERFPQFYKFAPPKCIFKSEEKTLDWLLAPFNKKNFLHLTKKNTFNSIDFLFSKSLFPQ